MKKAFSLMEVIIAIAILSFSMVTLLEIKSENIYLLSKSDEIAKKSDYILMAINLKKTTIKNRNIDLEKKYNFNNDEIRKMLKKRKVNIINKKVENSKFDSSDLSLSMYETKYSLNNSSKKIYNFDVK